MKYRIITYGCQMNKSDSERIATVLENIGYQPASNVNEADLIVVNMCSVRQSAVDRVFGLSQKFSKLKIKNKKLKIILTGCILREDRKKFRNGFDLILNIKDLPNWPKIIKRKRNALIQRSQNYRVNYFCIQPKYQSNFSAFIPISNGCNNFCSYCVVPYTRGCEKSRGAKEIIQEVKSLIKKGYKEIILLGQNVNSYKDKKINFPNLLKKINGLKGDFRLNFLTSHPKDMSDELINTIASCQKIIKEIHLPVQSGDNQILKKMNRHYTVAQYRNLVKKIRQKISGVKISTDIIVGFPGETKKQFQNTVNLCKEIKFDKAYIAKYSPRPGTAAFRLKDNIPAQEKKRRWKILENLINKK